MFSTRYNEAEKLWYGSDLPPLYNPSVSIAQVVLNSLSVFGSKVAQVKKLKTQKLNKFFEKFMDFFCQISDDTGIQMTFDEIRTQTIRAAQNLQARGYKQKQVFGMITANSHHVAPIFFASIANGCSPIALDPSFGKAEIIHMLSITKPALMFCDIACYDLLIECLAELKNEAKVFTIGGQTGQSEPAENLFKETGKERGFM